MSALDAVQPAYAISGFLVGALVGLTGVGGGSLMTPLLILVFGINPAAAVGTDLLYAAVTKTAGSLVHGFNQTIDWRIVRRLAAGSIPMTVVTMAALHRLRDLEAKDLTGVNFLWTRGWQDFTRRDYAGAIARWTELAKLYPGLVLSDRVEPKALKASETFVKADLTKPKGRGLNE